MAAKDNKKRDYLGFLKRILKANKRKEQYCFFAVADGKCRIKKNNADPSCVLSA